MDIQHIYEALTSPTPPKHLARAGSPFALATAISLLMTIERAPLWTLRYTADELLTRFSKSHVPPCVHGIFKTEKTRYLAWRRKIFDLFLLDQGKSPDTDPIDALIRIARVEFAGSTHQHLYVLRRVLSEQAGIGALTRSEALRIDRTLKPMTRQTFRAALGMLDRLHSAPLAASSSHLLPQETIGRLPPPSGHIYHAPLPTQLEKIHAEAPPLLKRAIPFVYRLSVETGVISSGEDPSLDEFANTSRSLWDVDPANYGFERPNKVALRAYIRDIGKASSTPYIPPPRNQTSLNQADEGSYE